MNLGDTQFSPWRQGRGKRRKCQRLGSQVHTYFSWNWALAALLSQEDYLQHDFDKWLTSSLLPHSPRCSSPRFTWPHSPCVKRRPLHLCVTMALACARPASQEMMPRGLSSLPSWAALATRCVLICTRGFEPLGISTALWRLCYSVFVCLCVWGGAGFALLINRSRPFK